MNFVFLALVGVFSGVLGGMGMGGGTLLIPLLTIFFNFNQKLAQGINLISFSIMAIVIIVVHIKNKLIDIKVALVFAGLALITAVLGAYLASIVKTQALRTMYGALLIGIAAYQAWQELKRYR